jgi:hypothetical protein
MGIFRCVSILCHFATLAAHAVVLMTVPKCSNTDTVLLKVQQVDFPATDRQLLATCYFAFQVNAGGCDRCRTVSLHCREFNDALYNPNMHARSPQLTSQ